MKEGKIAIALVALWSVCLWGNEVDREPSLSVKYLVEASRGNLEHVYLVELFGGYVPIPRTFDMSTVFGEQADTSLWVNLHLDPSMKSRGSITYGIRVGDSAHGWQDAMTHRRLPTMPAITRSRGSLTIDYFKEQSDWPQRSIVISNKTYYMHLTGSAVGLANDLVRAYVAVNGPPDVFATGWQPVEHWESLPVWEAAVPTGNLKFECEQRILRWQASYSHGDFGGAYVLPGSDRAALHRLGFQEGDLVKAVDQVPLSSTFDLYGSLHEITNGTGRVFLLNRKGANIRLRLEPNTVRKEFAACWGGPAPVG